MWSKSQCYDRSRQPCICVRTVNERRTGCAWTQRVWAKNPLFIPYNDRRVRLWRNWSVLWGFPYSFVIKRPAAKTKADIFIRNRHFKNIFRNPKKNESFKRVLCINSFKNMRKQKRIKKKKKQKLKKWH